MPSLNIIQFLRLMSDCREGLNLSRRVLEDVDAPYEYIKDLYDAIEKVDVVYDSLNRVFVSYNPSCVYKSDKNSES